MVETWIRKEKQGFPPTTWCRSMWPREAVLGILDQSDHNFWVQIFMETPAVLLLRANARTVTESWKLTRQKDNTLCCAPCLSQPTSLCSLSCHVKNTEVGVSSCFFPRVCAWICLRVKERQSSLGLLSHIRTPFPTLQQKHCMQSVTEHVWAVIINISLSDIVQFA